jgi:hypothetical protein
MAEIRSASKFGIEVVGLVELQAQFEKLGKMPKKYLNKAGREGIADSERLVKSMAPVGKTGNLKKSIKKKMETPNKRNKGVYRLAYNPKFNDVFQKKTTGVYGGKLPHAYIPSSVEYGYLGPDGHVKVKTMHWADKALRNTERSSMQKTVNSLNRSLDILLKK